MADFFRAPDSQGGRSRSGGGGSGSGSGSGGCSIPSDTIRGHLDRQPDGTVIYKVVFDVHGYGPDSLRTILIGERIVQVSGRTNLEDPATGKLTTMSFEEQFQLPENVDTAQLRSVVSNSQLAISAPVLPPQYRPTDAIYKSPPTRYQQQHQAASQQQHQAASQQQQQQASPKSASPSTPSYNFHSLTQQQHAAPPPQQQQQQQSIRRLNIYQLEIDLGREFSAGELKVSTLDCGSRLVVHGQRQVRSAGKTSFREFRDEFDLPSGLDLAKMTARLRSDGRVVIEAPFRADTESLSGGLGYDFQTLSVAHH